MRAITGRNVGYSRFSEFPPTDARYARGWLDPVTTSTALVDDVQAPLPSWSTTTTTTTKGASN